MNKINGVWYENLGDVADTIEVEEIEFVEMPVPPWHYAAFNAAKSKAREQA